MMYVLRVTWYMALQMKKKFEGLGDIIFRVMGQLSIPSSVEVTAPRPRHRQADITNPSKFEGDLVVIRWSGIWHHPTPFLCCGVHHTYARSGQGSKQPTVMTQFRRALKLAVDGRSVEFHPISSQLTTVFLKLDTVSNELTQHSLNRMTMRPHSFVGYTVVFSGEFINDAVRTVDVGRARSV